MTEQTKDRIELAISQFRDNGKGEQTADSFRKSIEKYLPKQTPNKSLVDDIMELITDNI